MARKNDSGGLVWRTVMTIIIAALFLIVSLIYVGFYANGYTLFQKIVVVIIAIIIAWTIIAVFWITWAGKRGYMNPRQWQKYPRKTNE